MKQVVGLLFFFYLLGSYASLQGQGLLFGVFYTENPHTEEIETFLSLSSPKDSKGKKENFSFSLQGHKLHVISTESETIVSLGPVIYQPESGLLGLQVLKSQKESGGPVYRQTFSLDGYLKANQALSKLYRTEMGFEALSDGYSVRITLKNQGIFQISSARVELTSDYTQSYSTHVMKKEGEGFSVVIDSLDRNVSYQYSIHYCGNQPGFETEVLTHQESHLYDCFQFQLGSISSTPEKAILDKLETLQKNRQDRLEEYEIDQLRKFRAAGHQIVVSLTTSPARLAHVPYVLGTMDFSYVDKLILVLPVGFGPQLQPYETSLVQQIEADLIKKYGNRVIILRPREDLGPISKILPTADYLYSEGHQISEQSVLISLDDDMSYPLHMIHHLAYLESLPMHERSVISGSGQDTSHWNVSPFGWPKKQNQCDAANEALTECDVVEGFAGISYRLIHFKNREKLRKWSQISPFCRNADDWVLSYFLAKEGISKYRITDFSEASIISHSIQELPFGLRSDALHRGARTPGITAPRNALEESWSHMNKEIVNYQRCHETLIHQEYGSMFHELR